MKKAMVWLVAAVLLAAQGPVAKAQEKGYHLGPGDLIEISIWGESDLAKVVEVRADGMISFPLVGEIRAQNLTPAELEDRMEISLAEYLKQPQVTVVVKQPRERASFNQFLQILTGLSLAKAIFD